VIFSILNNTVYLGYPTAFPNSCDLKMKSFWYTQSYW